MRARAIIATPMAGFPPTRHSVVQAVASNDTAARRAAFETLVSGYWKPVYRYLRLRWNAPVDEAQDLTQGFFTELFESGRLGRYDVGKARFRTFLRLCLDGYVINVRKAGRRLKRGGGRTPLALDFTDAEGEPCSLELPVEQDLDALFHHEWVRALCAHALQRLRERCEAGGRSTAFAILQAYDIEDAGPEGRPTYAALAARHGLPVTQVTNYLARLRRELRVLILERLRELTADEREYRAEARALLGVDPP
jgi:RNA polymerase sigma factor (sigma-70 family)